MKRCVRSRAQRGAFTLMEMLVVLAILVLLVGMVVPNVLKSQKKSDIQNTKAQVGMLRQCLERYAIDCKIYPSSDQGLGALLSKPSDLDDSVNWDGPYISTDSLPKDPWGHDYKYELVDDSTPHIWSMGPDGQDGTDDDIKSWSDDSSSGSGSSGSSSHSSSSGSSGVKSAGSASRSGK
jgi:general secretion pathway protein G